MNDNQIFIRILGMCFIIFIVVGALVACDASCRIRHFPADNEWCECSYDLDGNEDCGPCYYYDN